MAKIVRRLPCPVLASSIIEALMNGSFVPFTEQDKNFFDVEGEGFTWTPKRFGGECIVVLEKCTDGSITIQVQRSSAEGENKVWHMRLGHTAFERIV